MALVSLGIALGAAMLASVLAVGGATEQQSFQRAVSRVPESDRTVAAFVEAPPAETEPSRAALDRLAREALAPFGDDLVAATWFPEVTVGRSTVDVAAVDDPGRWVRLTSGRLPRGCTPTRCEVVQVAGRGSIPSVPGLRLVKVGEGALLSRAPFGGFDPAFNYLRTAQPPYLLSDDVAGVAGLAALRRSRFGTYAWVSLIDPGDLHPWEIAEIRTDLERARSAVARESPRVQVSAPLPEIEEAASQSRVAERRLLLVAGQGAALLLAFALLAAASLRPEAERARQRLTWSGARRWQLVSCSVSEAAATAGIGALLGWLLGLIAGLVVARGFGAPGWPIVREALLSPEALLVPLCLGLLAAVLLVATLHAAPLRVRGLSVSPIDVAGIGAAVAVVLALSRGAADPEAIEREGSGLVLLVLPALIVFVAAVVFSRLLTPALRGLEHLGRRGPLSTRLASLSLARNPGYATVAVTFIVVSLGLALFAETYRATLFRGADDQAAFTVPLSAIVRQDVTRAFDAISINEAGALSSYPGEEKVEVLRLQGSAPAQGRAGSLTLLGLPSTVLPQLDGWRSDFSESSPAVLADRLRRRRDVELRGELLPAGRRELVLPIVSNGDPLDVQATVRTRGGKFVDLDLGDTDAPALRARLPGRAVGGELFSLTFEPSARIIRIDETTEVVAAGGVRMRAMPGMDLRDWVGMNGIEPTPARGGVQLDYVVSTRAVGRFRISQPTDGRPVPAVVSPSLAATADENGILPIRVGTREQLIRVVGVARRIPTVPGLAVLAERTTIATALNAESPGVPMANEIWIGDPDPDRLGKALRQAPFDRLALTTRRQVEEELAKSPLAQGSLIALAGAAVAALSLALIGLLIGLVSDLRDVSGELFDLEAQGIEPASLRRHLRLRTLFVAAFGLMGGLATGAVLSAVVVAIVQVTAGATTPEPPLLLTLDWRVIALAFGCYGLFTAGIVGALTRRAFRGAAVRHYSEAG